MQAEVGAGEKREGEISPGASVEGAERAAARLQVCNEISRSVNECVLAGRHQQRSSSALLLASQATCRREGGSEGYN